MNAPSRHGFAAAALCVLAVTTAARPAHADDVAMAEQLFVDARRLMEQERFVEACEKFKAAHDLDSTATGTLLNLALCHERIKRNATAWAEFRQVAAESAGRREDRVSMARSHEAKLAPLLSFVTIRVPSAVAVKGMHVELDASRTIPEASWGVELPIDPGKHVIDAAAPGKVTRSIEIVIGDAERKTVDVPPLADAPKEAAPPPPNARVAPTEGSQRFIGYVAFGAGIVALSAGAVLGGITIGKSSKAEDAAKACPNDLCPSEAAKSNATDAASTASTFANVTNVAVGAGVVMLAAGIVLVVTAPPRTAASRLASALTVAADGRSLSLGGRW